MTHDPKGEKDIIRYYSAKLSEANRRWSKTEKYCFAIKDMIVKYQYILHRKQPFIIKTDNAVLLWLRRLQSPTEKLRHLQILFQGEPFTVEHIRSKPNPILEGLTINWDEIPDFEAADIGLVNPVIKISEQLEQKLQVIDDQLIKNLKKNKIKLKEKLDNKLIKEKAVDDPLTIMPSYQDYVKLVEKDVPTIFIDGSCLNNGKDDPITGIGIYWGDPNHKNNVSELLPIDITTNNGAELSAAVRAIEMAIDQGFKKIQICSDSQYLVNGITIYIHNWVKKDWRTKGSIEPKNLQLWKTLFELKDKIEIVWRYVRSHAGVVPNEYADELAKAATDQAKFELELGKILNKDKATIIGALISNPQEIADRNIKRIQENPESYGIKIPVNRQSFSEAQLADPFFNKIIQKYNKNKRDVTVRDYLIIKDILYRGKALHFDEENPEIQICVPQKYQRQTIEENHIELIHAKTDTLQLSMQNSYF